MSVTLFDNGHFRFDYGPGNQNLTPTIGVSAENGSGFVVSRYIGFSDLRSANSLLWAIDGQVVFADVGALEFQGDSGDVVAAQVVGVGGLPADGGTTSAAVTEVEIEFTEPLDAISARSTANFELIEAGVDGDFDTTDDVVVGVVPMYESGDLRVVLTFANGLLPDGTYRLTISGGKAVFDTAGNALDGDGDATAGGNFVRVFTVATDTPPQVVEVSVGGTTWAQAFVDDLSTQGRGYSIPLGGASQLAALPWSTIDTVSLRFSKHVEVSLADLALHGVNRPSYATIAFQYDPVTFTATWTFDHALETDKFLVYLPDRVKDRAGNALDGEWTDGASRVSGDRQPGGDFSFRFNIAVGDTDQDGATTVFDIASMRSSAGSTVGSVDYSPFADLDSDGQITIRDIDRLRSNLGRQLPFGEPVVDGRMAT